MTGLESITPEQESALNVARDLAAAGIPIFVAPYSSNSKTGFAFPMGWEKTPADPAIVDQWRPGYALCAVMGQGLDLIDIDPRSGGDARALNGFLPYVYGGSNSPSGGMHFFIKSLGVGSKTGFIEGIDFKSGSPDGSSRGFAFIAPTVRVSKVDGVAKPYTWFDAPDMSVFAAHSPNDTTGEALATKIREAGPASVKSRPTVDLGEGLLADFFRYKEPQSWQAADRAIAAKLYDVETFDVQGGSGFRDVLMRASFALGGYVGGGYLDETTAREKLEDAITAGPFPDGLDQDDQLWIDQGIADGAQQPFSVYTHEEELAYLAAQSPTADYYRPPTPTEAADTTPEDAPPPPPPPIWHPLAALGNEPFDYVGDQTDQGKAKAVLERVYPILRYAKDTGQWLQREAEVWVPGAGKLSTWAVTEVVEIMPYGLADLPPNKNDYTAEHWQFVRRRFLADTAGRNRVATSMEAVVHGVNKATVKYEHLDADTDIMWAGGWPWDLRASKDVPVVASWVDLGEPHMHTAMCGPNPNIPTPRWNAFLEAVFPDPELRAWALRVLSVTLTGRAAPILPVLYGRERSGKTSLIQFLIRILGTYAHAADPSLVNPKDSASSPMIAELKGRRLSFIDEGPQRGYSATERLKQLTGGSALTAAKKYAHPFSFTPTHTLVMTTNNEPSLTDPALKARLRVIPCNTPEEIVRPAWMALNDYRLRAEAPGILASLMREAALWLEDQDTASYAAAPAWIVAETEAMAEDQDPVREWVTAYTRPADPGTPGKQLYDAFCAWHDLSPTYRKQSQPSNTLFGRVLNDMGYAAVKRGGLSVRPLAILGGFNGGFNPPPPAHSNGLVLGGSPEGPGGLNPTPSNSEVRSSTPVSTSEEGGLDSSSTILNKVISSTSNVNIGGGIGKNAPLSPTFQPQASDQQEQAGGGVAPSSPPQSPAPVHAPDTSDEGPKADLTSYDHTPLPVDYDPLANLTAYQVTVWASHRGITKTDARAELKLIKAKAKADEKQAVRDAKLHALEGATVPLPAGCDRDGQVTPLTLDQAAYAVRGALGRTGVLTIDVETSGFPLGHRDYKLRTVQLGDDQVAIDFDAQNPQHQELIKELLGEARFLQAHSATADLAPLVDAGLIEHESAWDRMHDTALKAKLSDPSSTGSDPGIKQLGEKMLGLSGATAHKADVARQALFAAGGWLKETEVTTPVSRSGWAQVNSEAETMIRYAASDVLDAAAVAKVLPPIPDEIMNRERLVQRMTAKLPVTGVKLDYEHVQAMQNQHRPAREAAKALVIEASGGQLENPGSPKQLAEVFTRMGVNLPKSEKTGNPSVAKDVLDDISLKDDEAAALAKLILDYRHHDTVLGTFLEPYAMLCEYGDGRARPTVYTLGTNTGRMSCVRPNLQQLPRKGGVRACITADPGQLMIGADFSGVELRVAAALSQDPNLMQIIADGRDIHQEIARQVWGNAPGEDIPTKEHRYVAKRLVFGRIYGGGVKTLAAQTGCGLEAANAVIAVLDNMTPGLTQWSTNVRNAVKAGQTSFTAYSGRVIHFDMLRPHAGPNYIIQGSAREALVDSLVKWRQTKWGGCLLLPVHDELDVFVPEEDAKEATATLIACMETELNGVRIAAEASDPSFAWQDSS